MKPLSAMKTMKVKCVVACINSGGKPDFFPCEIVCTPNEYNDGDHYAFAKIEAFGKGYERTHMVVFDENDGAKFLFSELF